MAGVFENLVGVADVIRVTKPYKIDHTRSATDKTVVRAGDAVIGRHRTGNHRGTVRDRESRSGLRHSKNCPASWCAFFPWNVLETSNRRLTRFRASVEKGWKL